MLALFRSMLKMPEVKRDYLKAREAQMTQGDRSKKMIAIMSWLVAKKKLGKSPSPLAARRYIEKEITVMGGNPRTIRNYLDRLQTHGLICIDKGRLVPTSAGKNWLENKVS